MSKTFQRVLTLVKTIRAMLEDGLSKIRTRSDGAEHSCQRVARSHDFVAAMGQADVLTDGLAGSFQIRSKECAQRTPTCARPPMWMSLPAHLRGAVPRA